MEKRELRALLVGMQTGAATVATSMEVPWTIKNRTTMEYLGGSVSWVSDWLRFVSSSPTSGSVRTAWSLEAASDSVSPSLSAPAHTLCLFLYLSQE